MCVCGKIASSRKSTEQKKKINQKNWFGLKSNESDFRSNAFSIWNNEPHCDENVF